MLKVYYEDLIIYPYWILKYAYSAPISLRDNLIIYPYWILKLRAALFCFH